ncbi:DUF4003 family protein [Anaerocolumna sp. AGMB13025]|uniref:DUF4003 family protein n=1 Tax=Anaerocolumna sp. AGMB13025 TaxID=3039116 RepID=UPI00241F9383|nr:DUF4003 family protein [Anaerocolumna sp. AGMB13025]WFR57202.1 DUF4003 family protein [Anaerocolumna sp. AGMB13025]
MINNSLQAKCDLFAENYLILRKNFRWDYAMMHCLGALLYTNDGRTADVEAIKAAKEIIKKNTGLFSSFKETTFFALSVLLSLDADPQGLFERSFKIFGELKNAGFYGSPYLTLAAFSIAKRADITDTEPVVRLAKEFYDAMKKKHRFLTSTDDYGYAAMLALTGLSVEPAINEMETCYELLKKEFGSGNALQSLTHVLTLGEESADIKCSRAVKIYDKLKEKGCKVSRYEELASMGILVLISSDVDKITDEIKDTYEILIGKKGLGSWSMGKHERIMYAAALVTSEYMEGIGKDSVQLAFANSLTSIVIAQQTAMIIAATAAAGAAASSSSGS